MAKVVVKKAQPTRMSVAVALVFGTKAPPTMEKATLIKRGRPLATTYRKA